MQRNSHGLSILFGRNRIVQNGKRLFTARSAKSIASINFQDRSSTVSPDDNENPVRTRFCMRANEGFEWDHARISRRCDFVGCHNLWGLRKPRYNQDRSPNIWKWRTMLYANAFLPHFLHGRIYVGGGVADIEQTVLGPRYSRSTFLTSP